MDDKLPISVLLLARDEVADLAGLLPTLGFAAEVVVVWDERGDAAVRALAERAGARVFVRAWEGFGEQRRFALAQCTQPWVLWIDADERLDAVAQGALAEKLRSAGPELSGFTLERVSFFLGKRIRYCGWQRERLVRVFRRERGSFDAALVHERLQLPGPTEPLPGVLEHHSYPTWDICITKMHRYSEAGAEQMYRAGRRANSLDPLLRAKLRFWRQYVFQLGFLDGVHGLLLCGLSAAQVYLRYKRLVQLGRERRPLGREPRS